MHTPGPWLPSETYLDEDGTEVGWMVFADDGDYPALPVTEDDARLIAAAPDLLAALESVLATDPKELDRPAARAAIAKAKGES